jgi:hypothetical protein
MPTARELLEQVDALMRRNRALAEVADIPELTDVVSVSVVEARPRSVPGSPWNSRHPSARANTPTTDATVL